MEKSIVLNSANLIDGYRNVLDALSLIFCSKHYIRILAVPTLRTIGGIVIDFTQPWPGSNVIFVIGNRKIYANRTILSVCSFTFKRLIRHMQRNEKIPLPGENFDEFVELMKVVHDIQPCCEPTDGKHF